MSDANSRQVGGDHYKTEYEHWDFIEETGTGYLEGVASKYVTRWRKKDGRKDLEKASHYVQKIRELLLAGVKTSPESLRSEDQLANYGSCFAAFCDVNLSSDSEVGAVGFITNWTDIADLDEAQRLIGEMIATLDAEAAAK